MKIDLSYLYELGYSSDELEELSNRWNECILEYLSNNSAYVLKNMKYLQKDFDKDILFVLTIQYADAFSLHPEEFVRRISLLKEAFPTDWVDIIIKQFWGYEGLLGVNYEPFLEVMGSLEARGSAIPDAIINALDVLRNPSVYTFGFMVLLSKIGIDIEGLDVQEDAFLDLEVGKHEILLNAQMLDEEGMATDIITQMIYFCPYFMILSKVETKNKLIKVFGNDYISEMEKQYQEDILNDSLIEKLF